MQFTKEILSCSDSNILDAILSDRYKTSKHKALFKEKIFKTDATFLIFCNAYLFNHFLLLELIFVSPRVFLNYYFSNPHLCLMLQTSVFLNEHFTSGFGIC